MFIKQAAVAFFSAIALAVASLATAGTAVARDGGGARPAQTAIDKTAKELKVIGTPARTRAKMIATVGTVVGTAVGEAATTTVTCIARCFGVKTNYTPGDMTKQAFSAIKKMWGFGDSKPATKSSKPRRFVDPFPPRTPGYGNGLGTPLGYQAIPLDR